MIEIAIPLSYNKEYIYDIVDIINSGKYSYNKEYKISSFFGSFNNCIWNGGRSNRDKIFSLNDIKNEIEKLNNNDFSIFYTFSNRLILKEEQLKDKLGNYLLSIANNSKNGVIITSDFFYNYIKKNFPKMKTVYSVTNNNIDIDSFNNFSKIYDDLVLDFRLLKNENALNNIEQKNKTIILLNDMCNTNCKMLNKHTLLISNFNINYKDGLKFKYKCIKKENIKTYKEEIEYFIKKLKNEDMNLSFLKKEDINKFIINGFSKFKLSARGTENEVLVFYLFYYFIKEENYKIIIEYLKNKYTGIDFDFILEALNETK